MRGFTLVEILITMAIFSLLVGLGLFMTIGAFRGSVYRSEEATIVNLLQKARSRAMANVYQTSWSVCYDPSGNSYVIAKGPASACPGTPYDTVAANAGVAKDSKFDVVGKFPTVEFQQLSGDTTSLPDLPITVIQDSTNRTITINHEGTIIW